jgi:uncharacterized protein YjbI with pentapeptide repeats
VNASNVKESKMFSDLSTWISKAGARRVVLPLAALAVIAIVPASGAASGSCTATPKADCKGANMVGMSIKGADMRGADMRGADMTRMDMSGMDLRGADMRGANMSHANMNGADMRGAKLDGANMSHTVMGNANMTGMTLKNVKMTGAKMRGAKLMNTKITGGKWNSMVMDRVNIGGAVITKVDFTGTEFNRVTNRKLKDARSTRATGSDGYNDLTFNGGHFDVVKWNNVSLTDVNFYGTSTWRSTQAINSQLWFWNFAGNAQYFETTGWTGNDLFSSTFGGTMYASWWMVNNDMTNVTCNFSTAVPSWAQVWGVGGWQYDFASGRGDSDPLVIGNFGFGSYNQGPAPTQKTARWWWDMYFSGNNHGSNNCTWGTWAFNS